MSLNTKTYSKLLRETAKRNGVALDSRWTDSPYAGRVIRDHKRVVTFRINTTTGNFDKFIKELSTMTLLISGKAPRFTAPRSDIETMLVKNGGTSSWKRVVKDSEFTYLKYNTVAA